MVSRNAEPDERFEILIEKRLRAAETPAERVELDAHLSVCDDCRRHLDDAARAHAALDGAFEAAERRSDGSSTERTIRERIRRRESRSHEVAPKGDAPMDPKWESPPGELEEALVDGRNPRRRWVAALFAGCAAATVILCFQTLSTSVDDHSAHFPSGTEYTRLKVEVGTFAYVALEHIRLNVEKTGVVAATSSQNALNEIVIKGLEPGESKVAVEVDANRWYILDVTVSARAEWPPRWTDDDRLRAAENLKREADALYAHKEAVTESLVPALYRYRKVIRFYDNCNFYPPAPYQEARERADELGAQVTEMEKSLVRSFYGELRQGNYAAAKTSLEDLLLLFPAEGDDNDPLAQHGDRGKYHEYFLMSQRFQEAEAGKGR